MQPTQKTNKIQIDWKSTAESYEKDNQTLKLKNANLLFTLVFSLTTIVAAVILLDGLILWIYLS